MKILIAEDDRTCRAVLTHQLVQWGHEVVACADGDQAWNKLQPKDSPRLIILDWMLPKMEGVEICRKVRQLHPLRPLYILLLTSKSDTKDIVAGLEAGADDYMHKPYNPHELQARLKVGMRLLDLQARLLSAEQHRVMIQMAGAAAHRINQPLTIIMGLAEVNQKIPPSGGALKDDFGTIFTAAKKIHQTVAQMNRLQNYATESYLDDEEIIDFSAASRSHKKTND